MFSIEIGSVEPVCSSPQFFADGSVERATREERESDYCKNEIVHDPDNTVLRAVRLIKNRLKTVKKTLRPAIPTPFRRQQYSVDFYGRKGGRLL